MTLFDRAVDMQLKLEVAQTADTGLDLLARAAKLDEALTNTAAYFEAVAQLRRSMPITDRPNLDTKAISQAVATFRGGISRHGSAAFQHQPAAALVDTAKSQRERCSRWLVGQWRLLFSAYDPLLDRVTTERPTGSGSHPVVAQARASNLRALRGLDPVADREQISSALKTEDAGRWPEAIAELAAQLATALAALDAEHSALTPEVRSALERAASDGGLPLDELSPELLAALRSAGVDGQLIVRRQ